MGVIGRREFELIMKMDDQTRKERESLNRGLGDIERTSKKASAEAKRSIIDVAKQSKQSMEGIKAVMELGGWLAMANMVGSAFMNITEEARKNSVAFKEAGAALDIVGKKIGTGLVKALEPLAEGFTQVMRYGAAVFENFPEVAMATFGFVKTIITKTLSWEGLSAIFTALAKGIFSVFATAFQYIPQIFNEIIGLMFSPIAALGQYLMDTIKNALTGKKIEDPFTFIGKQIGAQLDRVGALATTFGAVIGAQVQNVGKLASDIGAVYSRETSDYLNRVSEITGKTLAGFDASLGNKPGSSVDSGAASKYSNLPLEAQQGLLMYEASIEGLKRQAEAAQAAKEALQALRAQAQAVAQAEQSRKEQQQAMLAKLSNDNLTGKNGLGAGIGEGIGKTEVGMGMSAGAASAAAAASAGGPVAMIIAMIVKVISTIQNLMAVLNPIGTIFDAMMEVLGPLINNLLAPLVGILKIVGYVIGRVLAPALEILRPIIGFIADLFVMLYNIVIKPIANAIILVFNLLYNAVAGMMNGIIWLINAALGWAGVHLNYVDYKALDSGALTDINTSDVNKSGSTGAGGSASYAAGTLITIEKIEIKADFIAGDAGLQEVAVMLRDKLVEAERAGR